MKESLQAPAQEPIKLTPTPNLGLRLQRKCACGGHASGNGDCDECRQKRVALKPRSGGDGSFLVGSFEGHDFSRVRVNNFIPPRIQTKSNVRKPGDVGEQEADQAAEQVTRMQGSANFGGSAPPARPAQRDSIAEAPAETADPVRRQREGSSSLDGVHDECPTCRQGGLDGKSRFALTGVTEDDVDPRSEKSATAEGDLGANTPNPFSEETAVSEPAERPEPGAAAARTLIVEDDAPMVESGQIRKTDFLAQLRSAVCASADEAMAATGRDSRGCPYVDSWFGYYSTRSASQIERSLLKYAPEAGNVRAASDYFSIVATRVARGVSRWATTGEITEVPDELREAALGGGILGTVASAVSTLASAVSSIFAKSREGGPCDADPAAVRSQLGAGTPLDVGVRRRMESAFGHDFSRVRVHNDSHAANLSDRVNARAFTIGHDVAFAAGEYQPGTPVGDALLAHELAHVVQQSNAAPSDTPVGMGDGAYDTLEADADECSTAAVASLWGGSGKGLANIAREAIPRMRSGLRLSRCKSSSAPAPRHPMTASTSGNRIDFTFDPTAKTPKPNCDRIVIVQLIQMVIDGSPVTPGNLLAAWTCRDPVVMPGTAHYIDHDCGCSTPYYTDCFNGTAGVSTSATTQNATSFDAPRVQNDTIRKWKSPSNAGGIETAVFNFETYGYCGHGAECGQWYEGIQWTYNKTAAQHTAGSFGTSTVGSNLPVPGATSTVVATYNRFNTVKSFTPC